MNQETNRRDFLKTTGRAASGLAMTGFAWPDAARPLSAAQQYVFTMVFGQRWPDS